MRLEPEIIKNIIQEMVNDYKLQPAQVVAIIQAGVKAAFKKDFAQYSKNNINVVISGDGAIKIYKELEIVDDLVDKDNQILLSEIIKQNPNAQIGAKVLSDITPENYSPTRIASQSAAQVIKQEVKKVEREKFYEKFAEKQGELLKGVVLRVAQNNILLDIEGTSVALPSEGQIPGKEYYIGEKIFVLLNKIAKDGSGITLDITQSSTDFIEALLYKIIPELEEEKVAIDKIVRIPGRKCKIVVSSDDENVDPVGVFVGQKGSRINTILQLLDGEKIDFIEYTDDQIKFLADCLKPAHIKSVTVQGDQATVDVEESQKSIAIGKGASNIKLATMLTGYDIKIV